MSPIPLLSTLAALLACTGQTADDTGFTGNTTTLTPFSIELVMGWPEVGYGPLEGATVALDDGAGVRAEVTTGADGVAAFEVDWSLGPVTLVTDPGVQGLPIFSYAGVTDAFDGETLTLNDDSTLKEDVTISGTIADRTPDTTLIVTPFGAGGSYTQTSGASWQSEVAPDTPFTLMAVEFDGTSETTELGTAQSFYRWTLADFDGVSKDSTIDLTLTDSLVASTFDTSFMLTDNADDKTRGDDAYGYIQIWGGERGQLSNQCGWSTWIDRTAERDRFEATGEFVTPLSDGEVWTSLEVYSPDFSFYSSLVLAGTPDTWTAEPQLLPLPTDAEISESDAGRLVVSMADPGVEAVPGMLVFGATSGELLWVAEGAGGWTYELPAPPSTVAVDHFDGLLQVYPMLWTVEIGSISYSYDGAQSISLSSD